MTTPQKPQNDPNQPKRPQESTQSRLFHEVDIIKRDIEHLRERMNTVEECTEALDTNVADNKVPDLVRKVARLERIIDGEKDTDVPGLRARVTAVEAVAHQLENERKLIKMLLIGVAASGVTNLGSVITLILKAVGGP